jgi:hypothetical protein
VKTFFNTRLMAGETGNCIPRPYDRSSGKMLS